MFLFSKPTDTQIREYLARQSRQPLSYEARGATRNAVPVQPGWNIDRHRVLLGKGEHAFSRAKQAIDAWQMFPPKIANLCGPAPPHEGQTVAILYSAAALRLWLLMAARVVYLLSETAERDGRQIERFGFAYGTLPDHPERGEERFLVEWDRADDNVWYDLMAFSQPRHWLARVGYPYARYEQARFRRLSGLAMQRTVMP